MEIEKLARKLEPLKPKAVAHWRRTRDIADSELRDLLDKHLIQLAYRTLGDFRKQPLLSLPPKNRARGPIHLGTVLYDKEKWDFGISKSELLQHLGVFGRSGSGKTNLVFHILDQLTEKGIAWVFLDWKRTGRHMLPLLNKKAAVYTPGKKLSPIPFNPFVSPPYLEPHIYINLIVDIFAEAYQLGEGAQRILQKGIVSCYNHGILSPTVNDVLLEVEKHDEKGRKLGWKTSAIRALESLAFANLDSGTRSSQETTIDKLLNGFSMIELNGLDHASKKVLTQALALWIFYTKLSARARERLDLVLIIEEAHHVLYRGRNQKESILERLLREAREVGLGIIIVDQNCSMISRAGLGNAFATLFMNQKDPADVNVASNICRLDADDKGHLARLPVGQAICQLQDRWTFPVLLNIPHMQVPKGSVTDQLLESYMSGSMTLSGLRKAVGRDSGVLGRSRVGDKGLQGDEFVLIQDILRNRNDGVDARYKRLRWSVDKGHRIKSMLVRNGWLDEQLVTIGRTRKNLLRLSTRARKILGIKGEFTRESIAHEFWKHHWAEKLREEGYKVQIEAPRVGGRVDVLATRADESVSVEIETGMSDVIGNVKKSLLSGFSKVVVVATDQAAMVKVEKELAESGLLIPIRVEIRFRDKG